MTITYRAYDQKVVAGLNAERLDLQRSCGQVLRQITESADCVHGMRSLDCIQVAASCLSRP